MSKVKFKIGDLVYCPSISSEILTIKVLPTDVMVFDITHSISRNDCGFVSYLNNGAIVRLDNGCCMKTHCQKIVHATQENYELLSKLYPNVAFEPPSKRKESKDIIKAMLESGYHGVLCQIAMVDEDDDNIVHCYRYDYALEVLDDKIIFSNCTMYNDELNLVDPFHQKSGMEIVDFVNGKIVLQNGEVVLESEK